MTEVPVINTSWTQMSTWNRCTYAWWARYAAGIRPVQVSESLTRGRIAHLMLHHHHAFHIKNPDASIEQLKKVHFNYVNELCKEASPYEVTHIYVVAYVIALYIEDYQPLEEQNLITVATEIPVEWELKTPAGNRFILTAIIDRIIQSRTTGKLYLGEYKTHSARPWTSAEIEMDGQQLVYLAALRHLGWDVSDVIYLFINVYDYKHREKKKYTDYFQSETILDKPALIEHFFQELYLYVDEVYDSVGKTPRRHISRNCGRCPYQQYCYTRLKGFSHEAAMATGYEIKEDKKDDSDVDGTE